MANLFGVKRISIVGDGQVRRLADARATFGNWNAHLPGDTQAVFSFIWTTPNGSPLRTITRLFARGVDSPLETDLMVFLMGANDLSFSFIDAVYLARLYLRGILHALRQHDVHRALVLPIRHRRADGLRCQRSVYRDRRVRQLLGDVAAHYNSRVDSFNTAVQAIIYARQDMGFKEVSWGHVDGFDNPNYLYNGVHLRGALLPRYSLTILLQVVYVLGDH